MTENGFEGNRSPPSWDMPGPSSLAAILDTVFTSSSDNQTRNGTVYRNHSYKGVIFLIIYVLHLFFRGNGL